MASNAIQSAVIAGAAEYYAVMAQAMNLGRAEMDLIKSEMQRLANSLHERATKAAKHLGGSSERESKPSVHAMPGREEEVRGDARAVPVVLPGVDPPDEDRRADVEIGRAHV